METMTYSITMIDSEMTPAWMGMLESARVTGQDDGYCSFRADVRADLAPALERKLERDDSVIAYNELV